MLALQRGHARDHSGHHAQAQYAGPDIIPFEPWHLTELRLQPTQAMLSPTLTMAQGQALQQAGPCYSAIVGMTVIACAGVVECWPGRSLAWSLLSEQMPLYYRAIHRAVKTFLAGYAVRRLECVVDPLNPAAIRWAEHLGFRREGLMEAYTPHGQDQYLYVRITRG